MLSVEAEGDLQGIFHEIFLSSPSKLKQEVNRIYSTPVKVYSVKIVLLCNFKVKTDLNKWFDSIFTKE